MNRWAMAQLVGRTSVPQIFVGDARKTVKVAHLLKLQGKNQMEVALAGPGEI